MYHSRQTYLQPHDTSPTQHKDTHIHAMAHRHTRTHTKNHHQVAWARGDNSDHGHSKKTITPKVAARHLSQIARFLPISGVQHRFLPISRVCNTHTYSLSRTHTCTHTHTHTHTLSSSLLFSQAQLHTCKNCSR